MRSVLSLYPTTIPQNVHRDKIIEYDKIVKYIETPMLAVMRSIEASIDSRVELSKLIIVLSGSVFILILLLCWKFIWANYLSTLNIKIWRTKGLLNLIPMRIITANNHLKNEFTSGQLENAVRWVIISLFDNIPIFFTNIYQVSQGNVLFSNAFPYEALLANFTASEWATFFDILADLSPLVAIIAGSPFVNLVFLTWYLEVFDFSWFLYLLGKLFLDVVYLFQSMLRLYIFLFIIENYFLEVKHFFWWRVRA